jgi:hypothetical protein
MGVTIHYRGKLRDLALVEELEDRLVDLMLELGGFARIWRSESSVDPRRVVRGAILDLAPGVESASLLLSPEGWLIPLDRIEDAEEGRLREAPWVFVKTQFGPIESHTVLVRILDELRNRFFPELEVRDEAEYWETRDLSRLKTHRDVIARGLRALESELRASWLSDEASEDPDIVAARIARLAERVHRGFNTPSEHPPVTLTPDELGDLDRDGTEEEWDAIARDQQRKLAWIERARNENRGAGMDDVDALEAAMRVAGVADLPGEVTDDTAADEGNDFETAGWESGSADLAWIASRPEKHPLVERVTDLGMRLLELSSKRGVREGTPLDAASRAVCELMGGTVQAMADPLGAHGHRLVQLKRALRGAAYVHGDIFAAAAAGELAPDRARVFHAELESIARELQEALRSARENR